MRKRWLIAVVTFFTLAGMFLAGGGVTISAHFSDEEPGSGNVFTAWVSKLWTQTTQADFNAGVPENVTIVSPGDVKLETCSSSSITLTNSPSISNGGWTNPASAYADGGGYASTTSGTPSASQTYWGYGFNLPAGSTIQQVRVRYDAWVMPSAPTFKAAGTFTAGTGAITPPYPTGAGAPVAGDIAILVCESENQPISLSSAQGFVELGNQANKAAGNPGINPASRLAVFWKRCTGSDTAPTVADSGDHTTGRIYLFSGVKTSGNPWNTYSEGNDGGQNDNSGVIPGGTTTVDNCLIFLICTSSYDGDSTAQFSGWTNAGLSNIWERGDNTSSYGSGGGHGSATAVKATAGSFGNTSVTLANASYKGAMMIALEPGTDVNDQIRVDVSWDGGSTWSSREVRTLTGSETTYWYDVTNAPPGGWDTAKLSNLRVRVDAYQQGTTAEEVRLDWLPVEVTYTPPCGTLMTNSPSISTGGWTNPANAYADGGGYASTTSGTPSASQTYGGYGFNLPAGININSVRVRYDAWAVPQTIATYNNTTTGTASGTTTCTFAHNVGTQPNKILIVGVSYENGVPSGEPDTVTSVTYNGVPMILINKQRSIFKNDSSPYNPYVQEVSLWYLLNNSLPNDNANHNVVVTVPANSTNALVCGATSLYHANQAAPTDFGGASKNNSDPDPDTITRQYTTTVNNTMAVDVVGCGTPGSYTAGSGQTERYDLTVGNTMTGAGSTRLITTAGTVTNSWTFSGSRTANRQAMLVCGVQPCIDDQIRVDVSWDGGTNWSSRQVQTLTDTETTYWYDVTNAPPGGWDTTKLSNLRVRVDAYQQGTMAEEVRLDWLPVEVIYTASWGRIASQVFDTGVVPPPSATWDLLSWDETLQSNTDITFEVRASDTPFTKDSPTPAWIPVGGTSPVTSGLPPGRYKQWRATLTTTNPASTPVLHEVRLWYDP